ncbi:cytochrome c oxidase assembly protein [Pseudorhodobacter sp. MZDSW-24AT]|uniref:cytochrome c oxidase assembly protein n=1 Tax=Pseudorhodobacter sp. MZDSW-24AT TaxID=2052957 RepID=UPI000C1DFDEF|nr:cytochrome c oxidase assembly protein [Pseudorhodobacter sp. MZDSW-24AT]PJF10418.1 cytochrome c oxidase assembly protein [Pseudorhodobacter sp. MZDSW-24AT]
MNPTLKTAAKLAGVVVTMASLSFAAVPFYDWFCRVTGFGGTTSVAEAAPDTILDQTIQIRFDGSTSGGMGWQFKPVQRTMTVRIGENALAFYEAHNPTDRVIAGTASYNVTPDAAGGYFAKIACFCFTEQVLQPGETVQMPVSFFVDPEIVKDREGKFVKEITLSYTFYETSLPEEQAALAAPVTGIVN